MQGVVNRLTPFAKNAQSGQFITWLIGVLIFFDDYANSLVVGNTKRPITDKLKISREKLTGVTLVDVENEKGINHPMYKNKPNQFDSFCWHYDEVETLPENTVILSSNNKSEVK